MNSLHRGSARLLVTDEEAWMWLWSRHHEGREPVPSAPHVDFARSHVLAVFLGERPDTCWRVSIEAVRMNGTTGMREVDLLVRAPGPDAGCFNGVTSPFAMAVVPADGRPILFRERVERSGSA